MTHKQSDILIIGAGLTGLMAATALREAGDGRSIRLLDKGRSVGGRLATRRIGPGRADHGAQFFTVRTDEFQRYVDGWRKAELVYEWGRGWRRTLDDDATPDGHPRYAVRGGFNALAKALAADLRERDVEIETDVRATAVVQADAQGESASGWHVEAEGGARYSADALVITSPVPQSLALLDAGGVALHANDRARLDSLRYDPCLAGLFWVEGDVRLPEPGALQNKDRTFYWLADNQRKGISPDATLLTLHADPDFSRAHYDAPDDETLAPMHAYLNRFLVSGATVRKAQLKRWRYAQPQQPLDASYLHAQGVAPLFFAGDAFGSARVEGAAMSGLAVARKI